MSRTTASRTRPTSRQPSLATPTITVLLLTCFSLCLSSQTQPTNPQTANAQILSNTPTPTANIATTNASISGFQLECPSSWIILSSPNPSSSTNYLFGIAAISPNDVCAV